MMGFRMLIIFALLQISLQYAEVNSTTEDLSNIHSNDSSNHHRARRFPSFARGHQIRAKNKHQTILDSSTYLELSEDPVPISIEEEDYYICVSGTCDNVKIETIKGSAAQCKDADKVSGYLVNKDNFEILEWNTWGDIHNGQIPFKPAMICNKFYITKEKQGFASVIKRFFRKTDIKTEILTLYNDIKSQYLEIDHYETDKEELFSTSEVIKQFKAENRNCEIAKHVVKLDQGSDRSRSFLKGHTLTSGRTKEFSVSGKIPKLEIGLGAKYSVKYEESRLTSETTSQLDKVQHSVSMEIQVPPNQSCSVKILSETIIVQVPYSGHLFREYGSGEVRTADITDMYDHQEVAELLTSVNPCTALEDGTQC